MRDLLSLNRRGLLLCIGLMFTFFALAGAGMTAFADEKSIKGEETAQLSLRDVGNARLKQLPEVGSRENRRLALVAKRNGKAVACSRSLIKTVVVGAEQLYEYEDTSTLGAPDFSMLQIHTLALLTKEFHPKSITWMITQQAPNGTREVTKETLERNEAGFVFTRIAPDGARTEKKYGVPAEPYAYFTPYLLEVLPLEAGDRFILKNLDAETGKLVSDSYIVTKRTKGGLRVSKKTLPAKLETEYFFLNNLQWVEIHGVAKLDLKFEAALEEVVIALERAFRDRRR